MKWVGTCCLGHKRDECEAEQKEHVEPQDSAMHDALKHLRELMVVDPKDGDGDE